MSTDGHPTPADFLAAYNHAEEARFLVDAITQVDELWRDASPSHTMFKAAADFFDGIIRGREPASPGNIRRAEHSKAWLVANRGQASKIAWEKSLAEKLIVRELVVPLCRHLRKPPASLPSVLDALARVRGLANIAKLGSRENHTMHAMVLEIADDLCREFFLEAGAGPVVYGSNEPVLSEPQDAWAWVSQNFPFPTRSEFRTAFIQLEAERVAGQATEEKARHNEAIPAEFRTRPLSKTEAAQLLGFQGAKAAEKLARALTCVKLTRQAYVFDIRDFPAKYHHKLLPR